MTIGVRIRLVPLLLFCLDGVVAVGCALAAYKLRFHHYASWDQAFALLFAGDRPYLHMMLFAPIFRLASGYMNGLYRWDTRGYRFGEDLPGVIRAVSLGSALMVILAFLGVFQYQSLSAYRDFTYARFFFVFDWILNVVCLAGIHPLVGAIRTEIARKGVGARRLAVQGTGLESKLITSKTETLRENGYELVGILVPPDAEPPESVPLLEWDGDILGVINAHDLHEIIVTDVASLGCDFLKFTEACHKVDVVVQLAPNLQGLLFQNQPVHDLVGVPVIQVNEVTISGLPSVLKRMEDILLSIVALALATPLLVLVSILIKLDDPGPVFFSQRRIGKHGRMFRMYKFRSMCRDAEERRELIAQQNESDGPLFKIRDDPRVTRVGRILRKTSIDELPQLINVLRGDMSLIGPRPLPETDIGAPDAWEEVRFEALPGITGMWQVNRIDHSSEEMLKWDLYYVENWSLWLDIKILLRTVGVVLTGKGAY